LQRARRANEVTTQAKHEFLMILSHELRTPLNAIYGYAQMLARGALGAEQQSRAVASIERNAREQARVIDDLLNASETATGELRLDVKDVDLAEIVRSVIDVLRPAIDAKRLSLETAIDHASGAIAGDIDRLRQVVWHIVSNAIKFTPDGGRIEVAAKLMNGAIEVSVTDTGVGIAPEDQEAVFEEFRQVGTADKKVEGTGLGLALSRKFIQLHDGKIWVKSQVGQGSTFTFTVPVRHGE
jgi:signal transduction histidine kinase